VTSLTRGWPAAISQSLRATTYCATASSRGAICNLLSLFSASNRLASRCCPAFWQRAAWRRAGVCLPWQRQLSQCLKHLRCILHPLEVPALHHSMSNDFSVDAIFRTCLGVYSGAWAAAAAIGIATTAAHAAHHDEEEADEPVKALVCGGGSICMAVHLFTKCCCMCADSTGFELSDACK
jgi:hypothetical protein